MSEATPAALLVTGASGSIGGAIARGAARRGFTVLAGYGRGRAAVGELVEGILREGGVAHALHLPLDDLPAIDAAVARAVELAPGLRALALCASPPPTVASLLKTPPAAFAEHFAVTVTGHHRLLAEAWRRALRPRGGGHVVAISTAALGPPPTPHLSAYLCAKAALGTLLDAAQAELGRAGLRTTTLRPGFVESPMLAAFPALLLEQARAAAPGGRFLSPDEVAVEALAALGDP